MAVIMLRKIAAALIVLVAVSVRSSSTEQMFTCEGSIKDCGTTNITSCDSPNLNITPGIDPNLYRCCKLEDNRHLCYQNGSICSDCYPTNCQLLNDTCTPQTFNNTNFTSTEIDCTDECVAPTTTTTVTPTVTTSEEKNTTDKTTTAKLRCSPDKPYWVEPHKYCVNVCVWEALHPVNTKEHEAFGETYMACMMIETVVVMAVIVVVIVIIIIVPIVLIARHVKRKRAEQPKFDGLEMKEVDHEGGPSRSQSAMKRKAFGKLASLKNRQESKKNDYKQGPGSQEGRIEPSDDYESLDLPANRHVMNPIEEQEEEYLDPKANEANEDTNEKDYENEVTLTAISNGQRRQPVRVQTEQPAPSQQTGQQLQYNDDATYENVATIRMVTGQADEEDDTQEEYVAMDIANPTTSPKPVTSPKPAISPNPTLHNQYVPNVPSCSLLEELTKLASVKKNKRPETEEPYADVSTPNNLPYRQYGPELNVAEESDYVDQEQPLPGSDSESEEIYENYRQ